MAAKKPKPSSQNPVKMSPRVWFYSMILSLQYGAQPLISKRFTRREVIVTSSVLTCEVAKVVCALILMAKDGSLKKLAKEWTLMGSLTAYKGTKKERNVFLLTKQEVNNNHNGSNDCRWPNSFLLGRLAGGLSFDLHL